MTDLLSKVITQVMVASRIMKNRDFSVEFKDSPQNYVTSADCAVEEALKNSLSALVENSSFLGEEEAFYGKADGYLWIVDPIDGTANFVRGLEFSAISVALCYNQEIILGVVYNPFTDKLYCAEKGGGAYLNGEKIAVSKNDFEHSLCCTALCLYKKEFTKICSEIITDVYDKCSDVRRFGTASLELCLLAEGKIDLYFELRLFPWDYAAGLIIIKESGGYVSNILGGADLFKPSLIVAANSKSSLECFENIVLRHLDKRPY